MPLGPQTLALVFLSQPARYKPARHACPRDVRASAAGVVLMFSRFHASLTACAALSYHLADRRSTRALSRRLTNITSMATIETVRPAASCAWAGSGPFTIVLRSCVMGELLWLLGDSTSGRRSCLSSLCGGLSSCFPCGMGRATRGRFPSVAAGRSRGVGLLRGVCVSLWLLPTNGPTARVLLDPAAVFLRVEGRSDGVGAGPCALCLCPPHPLSSPAVLPVRGG